MTVEAKWGEQRGLEIDVGNTARSFQQNYEYVVKMVGPSEEEGESCAICRCLEILRKVVGSRLHVANLGEIRRIKFVASVTYKEAKMIERMKGVVRVGRRLYNLTMMEQYVQEPAAIVSYDFHRPGDFWTN